MAIIRHCSSWTDPSTGLSRVVVYICSSITLLSRPTDLLRAGFCRSQVLEAQGHSLLSPSDRSGLHPLVVPLTTFNNTQEAGQHRSNRLQQAAEKQLVDTGSSNSHLLCWLQVVVCVCVCVSSGSGARQAAVFVELSALLLYHRLSERHHHCQHSWAPAATTAAVTCLNAPTCFCVSMPAGFAAVRACRWG